MKPCITLSNHVCSTSYRISTDQYRLIACLPLQNLPIQTLPGILTSYQKVGLSDLGPLPLIPAGGMLFVAPGFATACSSTTLKSIAVLSSSYSVMDFLWIPSPPPVDPSQHDGFTPLL